MLRALAYLLFLTSIALTGCGGGSSEPAEAASPLPPGTLDPSFGNGGKVVTSLGANARAAALALQPDGKIVVAGFVDDGVRRSIALVRYAVDGSLDPAFGLGGVVVTPIDSGDAEARSLLVQPDGKIVAAGYSGSHLSFENHTCVLVRYSGDGILDPTFGLAGVVRDDLGPSGIECSAISLQDDGRIVAVPRYLDYPWWLMAIRYLPDGQRDPSFGTDGLTTGPWTWKGEVASCVQANGDILVLATNQFLVRGLNSYVGLARFDSKGTVDASFGNGGIFKSNELATPPPTGRTPDTAGSLALTSDGRIVVVALGELLRFLSSGALDASFGNGGLAAAREGDAVSAALQPDGGIVTARNPGFRLVRFTADGLPDLAFGNGEVATTIGKADLASAVAVQPDGRIVAAGTTTGPVGATVDRDSFAVARYIGGSLPRSAR